MKLSCPVPSTNSNNVSWVKEKGIALNVKFFLIMLLIIGPVCSHYYYHQGGGGHYGHQGHHGHGHGYRDPNKHKDKPEYYSVLGLPKGSPQAKIKKAFKKIAIDFHPDRAPPGKQEEYKKKYQAASDAYDVLQDKEKKAAYDRAGHFGIEELDQQENFKNQQKANRENWQGGDPFMNKDVLRLSTGQDGSQPNYNSFLGRINPWIVYFYRSDDHQESNNADIELVDQLYNKFYGIFSVGIVDCSKEPKICEENNGHDTPQLKIFGASDKATSLMAQREGVRYTGEMSVGKIGGFTTTFLEDYVRILNESNFEEWMEKEIGRPKIVLLTDKKQTPPLIQVLSKEFKASCAFGMVKNDPKLFAMFGNLQPPKLIALGTEVTQIQVFDKKFGKTEITHFIRDQIHAYEAPVEVKKSSIVEISDIKTFGTAQCTGKFKNMCLLVLTSKGKEQLFKETVTKVSENFKSDPINYGLMRRELLDIESVQFLKSSESVEDWTKVSALLLKPSKKKVVILTEEFSEISGKNLLEKAISGSAKFLTLKGFLEDSVFEPDEVDL